MLLVIGKIIKRLGSIHDPERRDLLRAHDQVSLFIRLIITGPLW